MRGGSLYLAMLEDRLFLQFVNEGILHKVSFIDLYLFKL